MTLLRSAGGHKNIVQVLDCRFVPEATVLVLEFLDTDLSAFIKEQRNPSSSIILTDALIKVDFWNAYDYCGYLIYQRQENIRIIFL